MKIGIFGCGNMGRALALGMKKKYPKALFYLYTPSFTKAQSLAHEIDGVALKSLEEMPINLDWYLLGFKPQSLDEFQFKFKSEAKIISVLAGTKTEKLISKFNTKKIARLMPNTPSSLGEGANLLYLNSHFDAEEKESLENLLSAAGKIFPMSTEEDLDLTTAFSGSGPALIFELARIFESELTRMTSGRVPAKDIVSQTFLGSSKLMQSEHSFEDLRTQVTSKKGVTYEALSVLNEKNLQKIFSEAFLAAYNRTIELSK